MSGKITGGTVRIEETKQIADYQPRKAIVELHFASEESRDAEAILDHAADIASKKVAEILGQEPRPAKATKTAPAGNGADPEAAQARNKPPGRPRKEPAKDAAPVDELPSDPPKTEAKTEAPKEPADNDLSDLGIDTPAAEVITDAVLLSKISAHNGKSKNAPAIRQLIAKQFADATGKQAKDIPQEKRAAFIEDLHLIPAA